MRPRGGWSLASWFRQSRKPSVDALIERAIDERARDAAMLVLGSHRQRTQVQCVVERTSAGLETEGETLRDAASLVLDDVDSERRDLRASLTSRRAGWRARRRGRSSDRAVGRHRGRGRARARARGRVGRRDEAGSRAGSSPRSRGASAKTPRTCMRAKPSSYHGVVSSGFVKDPGVVFDRLALDPVGPACGVESVEHRGALKGDPVGSDPRAAPVFGTVEQGAKEVADDDARLLGDPGLARGVAQGAAKCSCEKPALSSAVAPRSRRGAHSLARPLDRYREIQGDVRSCLHRSCGCAKVVR